MWQSARSLALTLQRIWAHKPQAVHQVAPELVQELGEPFGWLWVMLEGTYGAHDGARVLGRAGGDASAPGR